MVVTIDVVEFERLRDAFRLLRRPRRRLGGDPAFARALAPARDWRSADLRRVTVIAAWADGRPQPLDPAGRRVRESWRGTFEVQRTHGTLGGEDPLRVTAGASGSGPGAIFTAGRVGVHRLPAFMRQNQRVVAELRESPGLRLAFGVMGLWRRGPWMCTLSFWDELDSGLAFAYRNSPRHREAVKRQHGGGFGAGETYFARLGLIESEGVVHGGDPLRAADAVAA